MSGRKDVLEMSENSVRGRICIRGPPLSPTMRAASASNGRGLSGTLREMMALFLLLVILARTRGDEGRAGGDGSRTPSHCSLCLSPFWPSSLLFSSLSLCSDSLSRIKARQKVATTWMLPPPPTKLFRQPARPLLADSSPPSLSMPCVTSSPHS